jgi:hypothetical protein
MGLELRCTEKMVLLALSDFHNAKTGQCNPEKASIASKAGLCKRAVGDALIRLKKGQIINFESTNGRKSNQYTLNIMYEHMGLTPQDMQGSTTQEMQGTSRPNPAGDSSNPAAYSANPAGTAPEPVRTSKEPTKRQRRFTDVDVELAEMVLRGIKRLNPSHKQPSMETWADDMRKMREIDKRQPDQIREVFHWANNDDFWKGNILSPAKLRKQFDQLLVKMASSTNQNGSAERPPLEAFPE